jgi:hypothetical protein
VFGYKLFRQTNNGLRSLFIDRNRELPEGVWLRYKSVATKGYMYRPGWHVLLQPVAPHLSEKGRVWKQVRVRGLIARHERPAAQGGTWLTVREIYIVPNADPLPRC